MIDQNDEYGFLIVVVVVVIMVVLINEYLKYKEKMMHFALEQSRNHEAQHGEEVWSITGNLRPSDFSNDGSMTIEQITILSQDKPPSYNEDPPTYDQAISMARANNIPIPNVHNSSSEAAKPAH